MPDSQTAKKAEIIRKAWTNPVYRQSLIADPKEVIAREFAVELPASLKVTVLEDTPDTVHLVLADPADLPDEEKTGPKAAILAKAWTDPSFKKALLADPATALVKTFDAKILPGFTFKVVEQTADHAYIVIPARPSTLSDADLDKVAGGMSKGNEQLLIDAGIVTGLAIVCPEGEGALVAGFALERAYQDRDTIAKDGKVAGEWIGHAGKKAGHAIGHAAKKVFHGW